MKQTNETNKSTKIIKAAKTIIIIIIIIMTIKNMKLELIPIWWLGDSQFSYSFTTRIHHMLTFMLSSSTLKFEVVLSGNFK